MAADAPKAAAATVVATHPSIISRVVALDTSVSLRIHSFCLPIPRFLLKALEISGDGRFWFPILIAILPLSSASGFLAAYSLLLGLLLGFLLDLLLVGLIKHLVRRPRPVYNKGMHLTFAVDHWSFPSGHSSRVFFIAVYLHLSSASLRRVLLFDGRIAPTRRWIEGYFHGDLAELLVWTVSAWSISTSASRVLLGRHYVLDVIAGACLGILEALIVFNSLPLLGDRFLAI
ncbi:putative lipid phosphate phosphatase beta [Canna indica]|uniref:Lipid phosphate phosphatase beta n=1 Tax=Canna indica TaxID=4628 RepID=A0AAQ3K0R4_9LILI|nr:putative lipid phosphate phosphatase beta [Canna indica]